MWVSGFATPHRPQACTWPCSAPELTCASAALEMCWCLPGVVLEIQDRRICCCLTFDLMHWQPLWCLHGPNQLTWSKCFRLCAVFSKWLLKSIWAKNNLHWTRRCQQHVQIACCSYCPTTNSNRAAQMWIRKVQTADLKISSILVVDVYVSCLVQRPRKWTGGGLCLIPGIQMPSVMLWFPTL